jgi:hypothetical protein
MREWLASGRVFDFLLVFIAVELAAFCAYRLLRQQHLVPFDVYLHLGAALGLLGAARAVVAGDWWGQVGLLLAGALLAHVLALRWRWHGQLRLKLNEIEVVNER